MSYSCPWSPYKLVAVIPAVSPIEPPTDSTNAAEPIAFLFKALDAALDPTLPAFVKKGFAILPPNLPVKASIVPIATPLATA